MKSVKDLLPLLPSEIRISKRKLRKIEAIEAVRRDRQDGHQELAYNARPFVLCGLPLRRPPKDQLSYTRTNGRFFTLLAGPLPRRSVLGLGEFAADSRARKPPRRHASHNLPGSVKRHPGRPLHLAIVPETYSLWQWPHRPALSRTSGGQRFHDVGQ
jgi:hypothetical protein